MCFCACVPEYLQISLGIHFFFVNVHMGVTIPLCVARWMSRQIAFKFTSNNLKYRQLQVRCQHFISHIVNIKNIFYE